MEVLFTFRKYLSAKERKTLETVIKTKDGTVTKYHQEYLELNNKELFIKRIKDLAA